MPANLSPEYIRLEVRLRETREAEEKLAILRQMLRAIPKHKGTDKMQADLKRRISKTEQVARQQRRKSGRDLFHVPREGAGQVILAGPPNAGKSSLLAKVTRATPQIANYPYTTQLPLPGMVNFEDVQIQLVDVPPLSPEYTETALFNVYRVSDLILFVVGLTDTDPAGSLRDCMGMLEEHGIKVTPDAAREQSGSVSVVEKRALIFANKVDQAGREAAGGIMDAFGQGYGVLVGSAETGAGLAELPGSLFAALRIIRVYTRRPGKKFERGTPFVIPAGATVVDAARVVHKELADQMRFTRLWGSGKYEGLSVPRDHVLADGDILEIHAG